MSWKASFTFLAIALSSGAARADEIQSVLPSFVRYPLQLSMLIFAMGITAYFAFLTFNKPAMSSADGPMRPRYMTQPRLYYSGVIAYVLMCWLAYDIFTYFFSDLLPVSEYFAPSPLKELIKKFEQPGSLSFPVIIVLATSLFIVFLQKEVVWNPLFILRKIVWSWVSIPQLVNTLTLMSRDALVVPIGARSAVASNPDYPNVDIGDFEKDRGSLDRHWAELCYVRYWLSRRRTEGIHYTFFNESSYSWDTLQSDYERERNSIEPLKRAIKQNELPDLAAVADKIDALRKQYCRLAAYFIVFKNETKKKVVNDAKEFGIPMNDYPSRSNPLRYLSIFLVAIIVAIYVGVLSSAAMWDLFHRDASGALNQDPNLFVKWTVYGTANYGAPVFAVLLLCYFGWTVNHEQPTSYPMAYARVFGVALCVSALSLTCAVKLGDSPSAKLPFLNLLFHELNWSLSPALISVYVAYQVDRQIDPLLPDIVQFRTLREFIKRVGASALFGLLVTGFSLGPTLSIKALPGDAWSTDKLRFVVVGTIFTIGFIVALVGEFLLIKRRSQANPATSEWNGGVATSV